jgi:protein O-mannosyl-transferase
MASKKRARRQEPVQPSDTWRAIAVCAFLVIGITLVFGGTVEHQFVYDDQAVVYGEPHVAGGLSWDAVKWAFTSGPAGQRPPLATLSHMLDCTLFGLKPFGHHFTNLALHAATAIALFLVLWQMTTLLWPSAIVAALFAFHPLHVESVVWVSRRSDLVGGLFFVLALRAYGQYVRRQSAFWYVALLLAMALGLMANPALVALPVVLLLLDYWPLGRFGQALETPELAPGPARGIWRSIVDKLPLLALSAVATNAVWAHLRQPDVPALGERLAAAPIALVAYLGQLFVPIGLSVFYAYPEVPWPAWQVGGAVVLLLAITLAAVLGRREYPYLFVGWFWYLALLAPTLAATTIDLHARADRYTYLSQIGLYLPLVWGARRLVHRLQAGKQILEIASVILLATAMATSMWQTGFWKNDQTLWEHAVASDDGNVTAHYHLGRALWNQSQRDGAAQEYRRALERSPLQQTLYRHVRADAENSLGSYANLEGNLDEAADHYRRAIEWDPASFTAHLSLGRALRRQKEVEEALVQFQESQRLDPTNAVVYECLGEAYGKLGQIDKAIDCYRNALKLDRDSVGVHTGLAGLLAKRGQIDEAVEEYVRALKLNPNYPPANEGLEDLQKKRKGATPEAPDADTQRAPT